MEWSINMAEINRKDNPEYFKYSREVDYGIVCDNKGCEWYTIGMSYYKEPVVHGLKVHKERFCKSDD